MALRWTTRVFEGRPFRLPSTAIGPFVGQLLFEVWALTTRRESATMT